MEYIDWQEKIIKEHKEKTMEKELKKVRGKIERLNLREEELRDKNDDLREQIFEIYKKMLRTDHWKVEDLKESARAMTRELTS
jgi:hypothetical protein